MSLLESEQQVNALVQLPQVKESELMELTKSKKRFPLRWEPTSRVKEARGASEDAGSAGAKIKYLKTPERDRWLTRKGDDI